MIGRAGFFGLFIALLASFHQTDYAGARSLDGAYERSGHANELFPRPSSLAARVRFWTKLFTAFSSRQIVLHDARHVSKIYGVLDLSLATDEELGKAIDRAKGDLRELLLGLQNWEDGGGLRPLSARERKIFDLFEGVKEIDRFRAAAERVRAQRGMRDRLAAGLRVSRRYLPQMERIFRESGLPVELTRLPFIESAFDVEAYSWRGAAGVWQFMPGTGRLHGLRIDRLIDQRRDPILATRAAARYLREAHESLGTWPLAITAYNQGVGGVARAVRTLGSHDIVDLIERYEGGRFGFSGQNFYPEFLAALDIDRDPHAYFRSMEFLSPIEADEVRLSLPLGLSGLADAAGVSKEEVAELNPSFGRGIVTGAAAVPRGITVRLPLGSKSLFDRRMVALAGRRGRETPPGMHRVRNGQTLSGIAKRYGTTVDDLRRRNGIRNKDLLWVGQLLYVQSAGAPAAGYVTHRVRRGQTLSQIAERYGTTVQVLKKRNRIRDPRRLRTGQVIEVPSG